MHRGTGLTVALIALCASPLWAIQISEIMYHPQRNEADLEFVEIYNETGARRDLTGWRISGGIDYSFPDGLVLEPGEYLVIAANPTSITEVYGITNVVGPFTGRLANNSERVRLRDSADGIITEVEYRDDGKWPVAADGAGFSLSKYVMRGDPSNPDNWRASPVVGGTPGRANGFEPWYEETELISVGDTWRYFKGTSEASDPIDAWRQIGFDDSSWLEGPTGIGYGDGDDATVLDDMRYNYLSVFCRKTFNVSDPSAIDQLILEVDHDDGFVAYLNGTEVGRAAMVSGPVYYDTMAILHHATVDGGSLTILDLTPYKGLLVAGTNVLAVQVHNANLSSSDLTFIPRLVDRTVHEPGGQDVPVVINEVKFYTSGTQFIELYNRSAAPFDVSGCFLSNDPNNLQLFQIPASTVIPGRGHVAFDGPTLGFWMNPLGDRILFTTSSATFVIDARAVEAGPFEMSEGRWPDGADAWFYMEPTTGTANVVSLTTSVVINEIMYHPPTGDVRDEYIELYNAGATTVSLAGWRFTRGVSYDFPATATIGPGEYLVIAKDPARLVSRYGLSPSIVLGPYLGRLSDEGEKVRLRDANNNVADEVRYSQGGHWPRYADGYGSSLELIDPHQDNSNYQAWAPSDETSKSQWDFFVHTGTVYVSSDPEQHELHLHLMGPGEVLIDQINLRRGGTEYIANGSFESGVGEWVIMGNHMQSYVTTEDAHDGSRCLKIVATGRGDTGANHIETDTAIAMQAGTYTLTFWARWLWGNKVLVTRCYNNQMPQTFMVSAPTVTGTPGAQNTAFRSNMGPVFSEVSHSPVVPSGSVSVRVTARVYDPDGVASVGLRYKADSDGSYGTATMYDDGAHGDGEAGDGVYGGDIPPRSAGQTVAFYLEATDGLGVSNTWPTDISRPALYRVESSPMVPGRFPTYRIILTQAGESQLWADPHLSNEPLNCTFIFNEEDVYYNCTVRLIGSPFHRARGGYTGFKVRFNDDELLHGVKYQARVDTNHGGPYRDRISYDLQRWMGLPSCQLEWARVRVNGRDEGVLEDTLPPSRRYLNMFYRGDADGYLFEVDDRFVFTNPEDANPSSFNSYNATFEWFGSDKDVYRHNYEVRNHDNEDDYTSIILMLDVLNPTSQQDPDEIAQVINVEQWFKLFAIRACLSDWDFIAFRRGKNCYLYWPSQRGKWDVLGWDSELTMGDPNMSIWSSFAPIRTFQQLGPHLHYYYSYLKEVMDKYFNRAWLDPWLDYYGSLVGGNPGADKNFIDARRAYLLGLLPNASVMITTNAGNPFTVDTLEVTLIGTAPVETRWVRVGTKIYKLEWLGATTWRVTLPLHPGENNLVLEFLDYDQNVIGTDSIVVTSTSPSEVESWRDY